MLSDKLISLLKCFSKVDLNRFEKYLQSPFFNENEDHIRLFDIINNYLRNSDQIEVDLDKKEVWKSLYSDTKFSDTSLRRLCSDMTQMALNFLAIQSYKDQALSAEVNMLSATNDLNLSKHYNGVLRKARSRQEALSSRDTIFHYNNFQIEYSDHKNMEFQGKKRKDFSNLERADYHLDCFYILQKLKNYCDLQGYRNIIQLNADVHLFPSFLTYVKQSAFFKEASIQAFYLVNEMYLDPDEEQHYFELKELLKTRLDEFVREDLKLLYTHLRNYCIISKINMGQPDYFRELFELYKDQVRSGIILDGDNISTQNYKNIITVALHIKEFDWVENFIQTYTDKLLVENQDNDRTYNLAKVYFHQEEYPKVIEQLREVEYKNVIYALGGKLMLLKTYFELKEFLALDSLVDSFRIYLRRNSKISKEVKQQYMNVIRFTKRLSVLMPGDQTALVKVKNQIQNCKALASRRWLLEKIGELEQV